MFSQKEIVKILDRSANRVFPGTPATPRQTWFLAGLMSKTEISQEQLDRDFGPLEPGLDVGLASHLIDAALRASKKLEA